MLSGRSVPRCGPGNRRVCAVQGVSGRTGCDAEEITPKWVAAEVGGYSSVADLRSELVRGNEEFRGRRCGGPETEARRREQDRDSRPMGFEELRTRLDLIFRRT